MITPSLLTRGTLILLIMIICVPLLFSVIGSCLVMNRLNGSWWKALIPFYNTYSFCYEIDEMTIFYAQIALAVAGFVFGFIDWTTLASLCAFITAILNIVMWHKICKWFRHGAGFTIGIIFLSPIFLMILGLEK